MRRLLALIPAALLVLTLAPAAQAGEGVKTTTCHSTLDPSTTGATLELGWTESGLVTGNNRPVMLLTRITVTNTCTITWARFLLSSWDSPIPAPELNVAIAPNTTRTLRRWTLERLGVWEMPFTNWYIMARGSAKDSCAYWTMDQWVIWPDGRLTRSCR